MKKINKGKLVKGTKGAISVFLTIILVPMTMVSSLFVDTSKVDLSKGVIESAGDLTLNTAMTDYDYKLKDLYGIFATSQDTSELYDRLESYYRDCITSSGVSDSSADDMTKKIMQQLHLVEQNSEGTSDILNMDLVDFSVTKDKNATLANPTVVKKEIVEFMKYRAPIQTGLSFLSSLKSFSTLKDQNKLIDDRKEYFEAEKSVMEKLKEAWKEINEYNKSVIITDKDYFTDMKKVYNKDNTKVWEETYKKVSGRIIKDLYETKSYFPYDNNISHSDDLNITFSSKIKNEPIHEKDFYVTDIDHDISGSTFTKYGSLADYYKYSETNLPSADKIRTLLNNFITARTNYIDLELEEIEKYTNKNYDNPYKLQYVAQIIRKKGLTRTWNKLVKYNDCYKKLKAAWLAITKVAVTEDDELYKNVTENIKVKSGSMEWSLQTYMNDVSKEYQDAMDKSEIVFGIVHLYSAEVMSKTPNPLDPTDVNTDLGNIYNSVQKFDPKNLTDAAEHLKKAREYIASAKKDLDADGALTKAKNKWDNDSKTGKAKDTSIAQQDREEIKNLSKYLNADDMQKMVSRFEKIEGKLKETANQIKEYKYYGNYIGDISEVESAKSAMRNGGIKDSDFLSVPINTSELNDQAKTWFQDKNGFHSGLVSVKWISDDNYNPRLHGSDAPKLRLYSYLYNKFNDTTATSSTEVPSTTMRKEDKGTGEDTYNNTKSQAEDDSKKKGNEAKKGNDTSKKSKNLSEMSNRPSTEWSKTVSTLKGSENINAGNDATKTNTNDSSMLGQLEKSGLGDGVASLGVKLRDKLYILDYAMSMFSYDTIIKERMDKESITEKAAIDKTRSLTLTPIDKDHNYAYGSEVEYFIYGQKNSTNVTLAYASIFGIRFGFNVVYAFSDSEIRETALAIATPISAATMGVIPVPLIQAGIIIGLACGESALDLIDLKDGNAVPLFKTKNTWRCSVRGLITKVKEEAKEIVVEKGKEIGSDLIDEGAKKVGELLDAGDKKADEIISSGNREIQNYAVNVYDELITNNANIAVQKLSTITNEVLQEVDVDPSLNAKELVKTRLKEWQNDLIKEDDGSIVSAAKQEAVKVILENDNISSFVDAMKESIKGSSGASGDLDKILSTSPQDAFNGTSTKLLNKIEDIKYKIKVKIRHASGKLKDYKNKLKTNLDEKVNNTADNLKNKLNDNMDSLFGTSGNNDKVSLNKSGGTANQSGSTSKDSTGLASFFSFRYSDYLKLFLLIGLYTNESGVLLRISDAIQGNMRLAKNDDEYVLNKSSIYVNINATVQVKPVMLALPLFADVQNNPKTNTDWYTIEYKDIRGY